MLLNKMFKKCFFAFANLTAELSLLVPRLILRLPFHVALNLR